MFVLEKAHDLSDKIDTVCAAVELGMKCFIINFVFDFYLFWSSTFITFFSLKLDKW